MFGIHPIGICLLLEPERDPPVREGQGEPGDENVGGISDDGLSNDGPADGLDFGIHSGFLSGGALDHFGFLWLRS